MSDQPRPTVVVDAHLLQDLAMLCGWFAGRQHAHGDMYGHTVASEEDCWGCQQLRALWVRMR